MLCTIADLPRMAHRLLAESGGAPVYAFFGEMGAGKTTFIKAICETLGVIDPVSSPTYSLVNEYRTKEGAQVYHFDFYRISDEGEAYDIGAEEYFESGSICLIEWPERIPSLLPPNAVAVYLEVNGDKRYIHWRSFDV